MLTSTWQASHSPSSTSVSRPRTNITSNVTTTNGRLHATQLTLVLLLATLEPLQMSVRHLGLLSLRPRSTCSSSASSTTPLVLRPAHCMATATTVVLLATMLAIVPKDKAGDSPKANNNKTVVDAQTTPRRVALPTVSSLLDQTRLRLATFTVFPSSESSLKGRPSLSVRSVAVVDAGPLRIVLEDTLGLFVTTTRSVHPPALRPVPTSVLCQTHLPGTSPLPGRHSSMMYGASCYHTSMVCFMACSTACLGMAPSVPSTTLDGPSYSHRSCGLLFLFCSGTSIVRSHPTNRPSTIQLGSAPTGAGPKNTTRAAWISPSTASLNK
jgi:hypothetical protein